MAQDKKTANVAFFERVEQLKLAKGWTWAEIAQELHLTRGMIHFIKQGKYGVSKRNLYRLEQLEKEEAVAGPHTKDIITAVTSNLEESKVIITPADFDRGFLDVSIHYARGEAPKGYPKSIQLRRPDVKAAAKLVVELLIDEDHSNVLLMCIHPRRLANQKFINLLTPFSYHALTEAAMELAFGARWREQFKQASQKR